MLDLLCIGEAMAELRQEIAGDFKQGFAGDTFNTAVYAARILGKGRVGFFSRIGCDPLSRSIKAFVESEDLDPHTLLEDEQHNIGIYSVSTDAKGERSFHYWRNQSAATKLFEEQDDFARLPKAKLIYVSGITMAILSPQARANLITFLKAEKGKSLIAYDSNYRPKLWESQQVARDVTQSMWSLADIALPSVDDEMALFDEADTQSVKERFEAGSFKVCVLKQAEHGPFVIQGEAPNCNFEPATHVVDTTAAGDSFNAGFFASYLQGHSLSDSLLAGHNLASRVVGVRGAIEPKSQSPTSK